MDSNEKELTLTPIAGKSGKAFMGTYPDGGKVFVKMNTTPILAGLAKEQIAPQLLWSRRLPDGTHKWIQSVTFKFSVQFVHVYIWIGKNRSDNE